MISALLALITPNKLSEFADVISNGLIPKTEVLEDIGVKISENIASVDIDKKLNSLFDDSFSALDYKTDSVLRKELKKYTKNATSLIVAQRIGTIINADKIVVLNEGECVGIGTHKELLKTCEVYREIAYSQLSKEELDNA